MKTDILQQLSLALSGSCTHQESNTCKRLPKTTERFNTSVVDTGLITSNVIIGGVSIDAFASGAGLSVEIALSGTSLLFSPQFIKIFLN